MGYYLKSYYWFNFIGNQPNKRKNVQGVWIMHNALSYLSGILKYGQGRFAIMLQNNFFK